jgi:hypothetical protein
MTKQKKHLEWILIGFGVATLFLVLYLSIPRPEPTWEEQVNMVIDAAHAYDEEALLSRINVRVAPDSSEEPLFGPTFIFFTPDGTGYFFTLDRMLNRVVPRKLDQQARIPPPPGFSRLGSDWFREAAMEIHISPDEAFAIGSSALQQEYADDDLEFTPPLVGLHIRESFEQDYGTRVLWTVIAIIDTPDPDSSLLLVASVDARNGEVLDITESLLPRSD